MHIVNTKIVGRGKLVTKPWMCGKRAAGVDTVLPYNIDWLSSDPFFPCLLLFL